MYTKNIFDYYNHYFSSYNPKILFVSYFFDGFGEKGMSTFVYYILIFVFASLVIGLGLFFNQKQKGNKLFLQILSVVFGLVFVCRYMLGRDDIQTIYKLGGTSIKSPILNFFALFLVWFTYSGNLILELYGFFCDVKKLPMLAKCISLPMSLANVCFLSLSFSAIIGANAAATFSARGILFAIEIGISFGYSILILLTTTHKKQKRLPQKNQEEVVTKQYHQTKESANFWQRVWNAIKKASLSVAHFFKKYWFDIFVVLVVFIATMPPYTLQGLFGNVHQIYKCKDFEIPHRIILYIGFVLPIIVHFTLKNKQYQEKKLYLMYICLGTLLSFSYNLRFAEFADPTNWPLHLCNTAMYIMPMVLMFNMKRFFYFTYFINVLGAFLAMLMPNYSDSANMFSTSTVRFYINHYIAFFMPILFVSLKMFPKPKFKQFIYSMIAFACYFVFVLVLNATYTGLFELGRVSKTTDFFFVNSDFIADKLGRWAEDLRDVTSTITVSGVKLTFYPVYQTLFFVVYVLLGLAVWFVYGQCYQIADNLEDMRLRKQKIKVDQLALATQMNGRSAKEPMEVENSNKLILRDFSKKYAGSDVYAVAHANLEVNGGEIFGFLGPNGAGKSTIIKTIVGIQPPTSGQILVCGYDINKQSVEARKQIGFVPDHYALYEKLTGREYINYIADLYNVPLQERTERIDSMVNRFELQGAFDNQIKTYSHGMKQKITIMSALVHNPKIWILDEPLTGLDPNSIYQVKECMKEHAKKGNIVFFSSHIIDVVERICDRIAIIKKGQILLTKSVADIEKNGTLEDFYLTTINGADYLEKLSQVEWQNQLDGGTEQNKKTANGELRIETQSQKNKPLQNLQTQSKSEEPSTSKQAKKAKKIAKKHKNSSKEPKGEN